MTQSAHDHTDLEGDPPVIADLESLESLASFRLGNAVYVIETEPLPDESVLAHLGYSVPRDTSAGTRRHELTFVNYGPVGALHACPRTIDGDRYYEVDLPDHEALEAACKTRRERENDHRAAVIPPLINDLESWADQHADAGQTQRAMALAFSIACDELERRRDAPYRGTRRWTRTESV